MALLSAASSSLAACNSFSISERCAIRLSASSETPEAAVRSIVISTESIEILLSTLSVMLNESISSVSPIIVSISYVNTSLLSDTV